MLVALLGAGVNLLLWACFFVAQEYEVQIGKLPQRKAFGRFVLSEDFLHIQDYYTTFWGDLIGLTLISSAFALLMVESAPNMLFLFISGLLAGTSLYVFHKINTHVRHRPNFACPQHNVFSLSGRLHFIYFLLQGFVISYSAIAVLFVDVSDTVKVLFSIGAAFYLAMFIIDLATGRFKRFK